MTSIAQISENEQSEITGTLKKFFADNKVRDLLKAFVTDFIERLPISYQHALKLKVA